MSGLRILQFLPPRPPAVRDDDGAEREEERREGIEEPGGRCNDEGQGDHAQDGRPKRLRCRFAAQSADHHAGKREDECRKRLQEEGGERLREREPRGRVRENDHGRDQSPPSAQQSAARPAGIQEAAEHQKSKEETQPPEGIQVQARFEFRRLNSVILIRMQKNM